MKKSMRLPLVSLVLLLLALFLSACSPTIDNSTPGDAAAANTENAEPLDADAEDKDTLIIGLANAPASYNPFYRGDTASQWAQRFIYESIVDFDTSSTFVPRLGEITTEDNVTFTVRLDPEANWTDGTPVTSKDVAFTLNTIADPDTLTDVATYISTIEGTDEVGKRAEGSEEISGITIIDDKTLELKMKRPVDLGYINEFIGFKLMIAPEHVFADIPKDEIHLSEPALNPTVTNGAYEYVDYKEDNYLELTANEEYYRGAPKIKNVFLRVLNDALLLSELEAGNIHMVAGNGIGAVPHQDIPLLENIENIEVEEYPSTSVQFLIFNTTNERFADERVRQAFAYALDRQLSVDQLLLGHGEVTAGSYSEVNAYRDETIEPLAYDPEKAQKLLKEADFDFSTPIELIVPIGDAVREQNADLIEQQLEAAGLQIEQTHLDFPTWIQRANTQDYEIGLMGLAFSYDPDQKNIFHTDGGSNYMGYSDPKMDALIEEGRSKLSYDERYPVYQEFQEYFLEAMPGVPLYSESIYKVQVDNLQGGVTPVFEATLADVHNWEFK